MDATNQLMEIGYCQDCFRHSIEKLEDWFARPCPTTSHQLVFAKQTGFNSYWPAKVIRLVGEEKCDIRYFGGKHKRAIVDHKKTEDIANISVDRCSKNLENAMKELHKCLDMQMLPPERFTFQSSQIEAQRLRTAGNGPPLKKQRLSEASSSADSTVSFFGNVKCTRLTNET